MAEDKKVTGKVLVQVLKPVRELRIKPPQIIRKKKSGKDDRSAFDEEIEKVMATLNRAWKALPEEHRAAFLDRVSEWLTSAGEEDSAS